MIKLNAKQLREATGNSKQSFSASEQAMVKKNEIYIILDNVLDTYNIGSIFRLADAVAAKKVYLCGGTETPPNHRIKKSSINTTEWVEWSYKPSTLEAIHELRSLNPEVKIIAIEQADKSTPFNDYEYKFPIAFIVGHETYGVSKEVLNECDAIVELPMFGVNISLNVMVSLGIVMYHALSRLKSE